MAVYLDYNATAPLLPAAREAMLAALDAPHNPASVHRFGREARKQLEQARLAVAETLSAFPQEIIFTASGTEANNLALSGFPGRQVLASAVEHPSVLKVAGDRCPVSEEGIVDLAALDAMLAQSPPAIVSVMLANNETGVIQPVQEVAALCKKHEALFHCDAAQGAGRVRVDFGQVGADMLTITGHKCGAPVGAAALVVKTGLEIAPLLRGGAQESGRRAGTENLPAIMGFAAALQATDFDHLRHLRGWLDDMEKAISSPWKGEDQGGGQPSRRNGPPSQPSPLQGEGVILGGGAARLPNTSCILMPGVSSEVQLMHFDLSGIAVSAGSACSSGRIGPSHVLSAMGLPEGEASSAIRLSGGWGTKEADIAAFTEAWKTLYSRTIQTRIPAAKMA